MTGPQLKDLFQLYYDYWDRSWPGLLPEQLPIYLVAEKAGDLQSHERIKHFKFMCIAGQKFVDGGEIEKAMRWLGFMQGVLWRSDHFTLDQLKEQSRAKEKA